MQFKDIIGQTAFIVSVALCCLCSCSTKVDLYNDFKDTTIIYGVIDIANDTNIIKIMRAFGGSNDNSFDANQVALLADSCNYPGKLDACLVEYKSSLGSNYAPTGRKILLDTMTAHNKPEGTFYAPDQKLYYTTEHFNVNTNLDKYRYKLTVCKNSGDTVSSEIGLIGGRNFQIHSPMVYFRAKSSKLQRVEFTPDDNEAVYQIKMQFNYSEEREGQGRVPKEISWTLGDMSPLAEYGCENGYYYATYPETKLFQLLEYAIGDDTLYVDRYFDSFIISIFAYGKELHNYIQLGSQSIIDYNPTNIHGGCGIFSSCHEIQKPVRISALTQTDLLSKPWGFKHLGY